MQYKLYHDDIAWLPEVGALNDIDFSDCTIGIDVPQCYAINGINELSKALGLNSANGTAIVTSELLCDKLLTMKSVLPVLHLLQSSSISKMIQRMDDEAMGRVVCSSRENIGVQEAMSKASTSRQGNIFLHFHRQSYQLTYF